MIFKEYLMEDALEAIIDYRGKTPKKSDIGIPTLSAKSVKNNHINYAECYYISEDEYKRFMVRGFPQKGDVLLTTEAPMGMVAKLDRSDVAIAQRLLTLRGKKGVLDNNYLLYLLQSPYGQGLLKARETGTTVTGIKQAEFRRIVVKLPDIVAQTKIGSILSALDHKIECNTKINDNLQLQLTAIFREWFIDAPESAEWPRGTFADLIEHTISGDWGKDAPTGNYTEMVYCIRGADIPEVKAGNKGKMPTRFILPKNYTAKKLVDGDIVVEISGGSPTQSTGRAAPVSESLLGRYDRGMVCTNFCKAIKPNQGYSMFVYHYWQHLYDAGVFFGYENGTTGIKNLDINGFIETEEIVIPPIEAVARFDAVCQTIANKVYANGLENERLAKLRDTLLPKLMSGQIDIASIEI